MQKYVIALYIRLSLEDYKYDSMSIENQHLALNEFISSMPESTNAEVLEFIDNGYSGTNFERPKVQELIEMVRANKIDCIPDHHQIVLRVRAQRKRSHAGVGLCCMLAYNGNDTFFILFADYRCRDAQSPLRKINRAPTQAENFRAPQAIKSSQKNWNSNGLILRTGKKRGDFLNAAFVGLFVYKKINFKDCVQIFVKTCCTAGVCGFMVFCVSMVSRIFMVENLNGAVEALLNAMGGNRYVILLCVNILLILFGMFLDDSSAMYICAPILTPVLANFGIDPVHFAAIMIVNLGLGCITPPCASVLFMGARVGKSSLTKMLPSTYSLILFVWLPMLAILTLFPDVALWLPRVMLGYGA